VRGHSKPQDLPPTMANDQQSIEQPERDRRHQEKVHRSDPVGMVTKERLPSLRGRSLLRAIYLATLVWPTSMPSLKSSPLILGAPHNGLTMLISRISRRISNDTLVDRNNVAISSANTA
jgi:hypothetical protein